MFTGAFNYWANTILGITSYFAIAMFIVMFFDLVTGVWYSVFYAGDEYCSKKGTRWIIKLGTYTTFLYVFNAMRLEAYASGHDWLSHPVNVIKLFLAFYICFMELKSIGENLKKLGYNLSIFNFLDSVFNSIKRLFKKNADIDLDDNGKQV